MCKVVKDKEKYDFSRMLPFLLGLFARGSCVAAVPVPFALVDEPIVNLLQL